MTLPAAVSLVFAMVVAPMNVAVAGFSLRSTAFHDQGMLPQLYSYSQYGCVGRNISPPLEWTPGPTGTKSYALTVFDPDARVGIGWWHWVAFDIPATTDELAVNAGVGSGANLPKGAVQGRNDFQTVGWGGPCPPPGSPHHYIFTLYALDVDRLDGVSELTAGPTLLKVMKGHVLGQARLTGRFSR